ncbi:MAG: hypothetical protein R3C28_08270 [Pirellulaceae bacterium]
MSGTISSLASDYQLNLTSAVVDAQITPLAVVVSGLVAQNKTYDGTVPLASVNASGRSLRRDDCR